MIMAYANFPKGGRIVIQGCKEGISVEIPEGAVMGRQMRRWADRIDRKNRRRAGLPLVERKGQTQKGMKNV